MTTTAGFYGDDDRSPPTPEQIARMQAAIRAISQSITVSSGMAEAMRVVADSVQQVQATVQAAITPETIAAIRQFSATAQANLQALQATVRIPRHTLELFADSIRAAAVVSWQPTQLREVKEMAAALVDQVQPYRVPDHVVEALQSGGEFTIPAPILEAAASITADLPDQMAAALSVNLADVVTAAPGASVGKVPAAVFLALCVMLILACGTQIYLEHPEVKNYLLAMLALGLPSSKSAVAIYKKITQDPRDEHMGDGGVGDG